MAEPLRLGAALLAAGASRRFGTQDKLAYDFRGKPLSLHAAIALPRARFERAWVITSQGSHSCEEGWGKAGFETVINPRAAGGLGTSVALAAQLASASSLDGLLIALADMPLVPREHFAALIAGLGSRQDISVSSKKGARMPPAVFGSDHFPALAGLEGEHGARDLLAQGRIIACPSEWLADFDTADDFARHE